MSTEQRILRDEQSEFGEGETNVSTEWARSWDAPEKHTTFLQHWTNVQLQSMAANMVRRVREDSLVDHSTGSVLKNLYKSSPIGPNPLFSSCFIEAGFVPLRRAEPEPSSPQADTVELTAFAFAMF